MPVSLGFRELKDNSPPRYESFELDSRSCDRNLCHSISAGGCPPALHGTCKDSPTRASTSDGGASIHFSWTGVKINRDDVRLGFFTIMQTVDLPSFDLTFDKQLRGDLVLSVWVLGQTGVCGRVLRFQIGNSQDRVVVLWQDGDLVLGI